MLFPLRRPRRPLTVMPFNVLTPADDAPTRTLAFHIIGIAKSLGMQMIAEGVETKRQRQILRAAWVHYGQG